MNHNSVAEALERGSSNISYEFVGQSSPNANLLIVWAHGWGQSRDAFRPMAASFSQAVNLILDFPGFGASPPPPTEWGTADYADAIASLIAEQKGQLRVLWVGHSFGCRVGIQLAARHGHLVDLICLIAAAGLPRRRSIWERAGLSMRILTFKVLKRLPRAIIGDLEQLRTRFGSSDYRMAGQMRGTFLRVISENLEEAAKAVACPGLLVYGAEDRETPPEIGARLETLMPNARLTVLPNQDHYSVLGSGRHIVAKRIAQFIEQQ